MRFLCASCIKQYVQPSYGCRGTPVVACMCVYTARKKYFIHNRPLYRILGLGGETQHLGGLGACSPRKMPNNVNTEWILGGGGDIPGLLPPV